MKTYVYSTNRPDFKGHQEGIQFDIVDVCAILRVFYYDPTPWEQFELQFSEAFEMKAIELKDALYLLFKIGSLNWMDAPFNIHLCKNWDDKDTYKEMEEIDLLIQLVDCKTGTVKLLRSIELKGNIIKQRFAYPFSFSNLRMKLGHLHDRPIQLSSLSCLPSVSSWNGWYSNPMLPKTLLIRLTIISISLSRID